MSTRPFLIVFVTVLLTPCLTAHSLPKRPPSPEAQALQKAVTVAISQGSPTFEITAGDYYFNDSPFEITNATSLIIGGSNSDTPPTLWFGPGFGVAIQYGQGVVFKNVIIDYDPIPYVFGAVINATRISFTMKLHPSSLTFEEFIATYPPHDIWPPVGAFDPVSMDHLGSVCPWGQPAPARRLSDGVYELACDGKYVNPGDVVTAPTRVGFTLTLTSCRNVTSINITIHASGNMAITEFQGDGPNTYDHVRLVPRAAWRPLASNADGFHSSGLRHGPQLLGVEMRNLFDDYFNVHNTFQLLVQQHGPSSALIGDYQLFAGGDTVYGSERTLSRVQVGEQLSFYPVNTLLFPGLGTVTIASISLVTDPTLQHLLGDAYEATSAKAEDTPCSACHAGLNACTSAQLYNITFTSPLPAQLSPTAFVNCDGISNVGAVITGCSFAGSASNLGRFKSSHGVISNNVFRNTLSQNLEISPLQNWLEGMLGIHDVLIANNVFHGTASSPVHTFGSVDVRAINNTYTPSLGRRPL